MSNKQSQKEAVFTAVSNVLKDAGIVVSENFNANSAMTKERRAQVNQILIEGFNAGAIEMDRTYSEKELRSYVSGLQSNWLRKDKRLNGGMSYVAKNPGSRVGSSDPQLKALRGLLSTEGLTESDKAEIQTAIDTRLSQIKTTKTKQVVVDFSALPADIAAKFAK